MKPATPQARELLAKLEALAERGIDGEKKAAQAKLARFRKKYDFSKLGPTETADIFAGEFKRATLAAPIYKFQGDDCAVNAIKWAIEHATGIRCLFRDNTIMAEATNGTVKKLEGIAGTISENFNQLWGKFLSAGADALDRPVFFMGLYDGLMNETREIGQRLPTRQALKKGKAKKKAVGHAAGFSVHPYTTAVMLGKQIRFSVPLNEINARLDKVLKGELTGTN